MPFCELEPGPPERRQQQMSIPKFSGAVPTDDRGILDALRGSEFVRKAATERDSQVLAFRKTAAEKLAKIDAAADATFPKLRAAKEAAQVAARAAEIEWRKACDAAQNAQRDVSSASHTYSAERAKLEAQLIETASAEIALFLADMRNEWEKCFKQFTFHTTVETNVVTGKKATITINNGKSIAARQEAIRDAEAAAEAMRLEPDQSAVSARLQELRNGLPAIAGL
jgi:hypothetical protein